eukprot:TRINITY_DN66919_c7_g2_i2.p1 TRINITY_DN66919_c7_g2~~TRINITY_DN66919_c7_g2_i2.p1  ORF type:complete len:683 (+),score=401.25 TRINITY_DN66919_c7_g2_i2:24-2072(+)
MSKAKRSASRKKDEAGKNVTVCVRVRPLNRLEIRTSQGEAWSFHEDKEIRQEFMPEDKQARASGRKEKKKKPIHFAYDHLFTPDKNNRDIYETIGSPIVSGAMKGYHGCIFAYGQTSSGKTYTIHGTSKAPGMIPQAVEEIFDYIEDNPDREFVLRVSYMEIYNEIVNDLLAPENTNMRIREDRRKGVFVEGLKEDVVMTGDQVFSLLHAGTSHRHIGRTNYNEVSSRSHTIFRVVIESQKSNSTKGAVRTSVLNMVDLAGSENAVKAGSGARIKETGYINKSLLTLGHVIWKLSEGNTAHIPYRDSKLTRILQSSLSGRAKIAVVCNISPSTGNLDETISTLKFANRAKRVKTSAKVNEQLDDSVLLRKYREEIAHLKAELEQARAQTKKMIESGAKPEPDEPADVEGVQPQQMRRENEQEKMALRAKIESLTRLILKSSQADSLSLRQQAAAASSSSTSSSTGSKNKMMPRRRMQRQNSLLRRKPGMFASNSTVNVFGTLPRNFGAMLKQHQRTSSSGIDAELDEPTGDNDEDDVLCDPDMQPEMKTDGIEDVAQLKQMLHRMQKHVHDKDEEIAALKAQNAQMAEQLEEKEKLLQEWDSFYITNSNKNSALKERLREFASQQVDHSKEMSELFDSLDLDEDEFDAPLVDLDDGAAAARNRGASKFDSIRDKFKSMEQDG